jgi:hypothetical protein
MQAILSASLELAHAILIVIVEHLQCAAFVMTVLICYGQIMANDLAHVYYRLSESHPVSFCSRLKRPRLHCTGYAEVLTCLWIHGKIWIFAVMHRATATPFFAALQEAGDTASKVGRNFELRQFDIARRYL